MELAVASRWQFISAHQFVRPSEPARAAVRKGLLGAIDHLRKPPDAQGELALQLDLAAVPPYIMERAAAAPDWAELVPALMAALSTWAEAPGQPPAAKLCVGAPHSGIPQALTAWAQEMDWRLVQAPSSEQILDGGEAWLAQFAHNGDLPLVIPRLERLFLRHHDGLSLLQRILDWLIRREARCLIGIDSWSWEYLNRVMGLHALLPQPLTLAPCDFDHLKDWLRQLAARADKLGFVFRQSDNGRLVLPSSNGGEEQLTNYLKYLASYSRGNPGVAWNIWRHSLQLEVDDSVEEKALASAKASSQRTMWVKRWSLLDLPDLTGSLSQAQTFVVHALLVHGGLGTKPLARILPLEAVDLTQTLHKLQTASLIELTGDRWQVTALAYPAVREALALEGYLVDVF